MQQQAEQGQLLSLEDPAGVAQEWAPMFRALGDPIRLQITLLLVQRPRSVKELQDVLGLNQALVSHHLRLLRAQEIVSSTARGRSNIYEVCVPALSCLTQCLTSMVMHSGAACSAASC